MSRVQHRSDPRVEVTVRSFTTGVVRMGNPDWEKETFERGQQIARDIERHVDDVEAAFRWKTTYICSHCTMEWETEVDSDEPVCCDAAQAEHAEANR